MKNMCKKILTLIKRVILDLIRPKSIFGWKNAFKNYGLKGFLLDSILPVIISSMLCIIIYLKNIDIFFQLKHLIEVGINIVPAMVALILASYTIMLTFISGDTFSSVKSTQSGKNLIKALNASFAVCLLISTITIILMFIVSGIANMNIECLDSDIINYIAFFVLCYLLIYSISILIGITIDIFNCGQTILIDKGNESK